MLKLVVWSPTALLADGVAFIFGREPDVDVVATTHVRPELFDGVDGLVAHAIPLEDSRQLFTNLAPTVGATLVAVLLARSPESLFVSRARLTGFADVVDLNLDTSAIVTSTCELVLHGPPVGSANVWTLDPDALLESHFVEHCRDTRDVEILRYNDDGHTDAQIAKMMNLNAQTVRNRVSNMLLESGMSNRTQLAIDFHHWMYALNGADAGVVERPSTIREF